ncbi:hypothetical protein ACFT54_09880 [Streptomyces cinereoruber]|uniref:hypothetical protein n=1 Tax=Streptomyces cinereoruber TaxID=67260 RepID=UPI003626742C
MQQVPEQQPRIPGVKYRKVRLQREVTTVIDGIASTQPETYDGWEPVPPKDWDDLILRGATAFAVGFSLVAVASGSASLGGLLDPMVPSVLAYGMGSVFALAWMYCLAIEWRNRTSPERARPAQIAGWFFLLVGMGFVARYGYMLNQPWAGWCGAFVDVVAKGAWWLLLREYAVPLDKGIAHWVRDQEQKIAARALLGSLVRRLNRTAAYQQAVGGAEYQAASVILDAVETRHSLPEPVAEPVAEPASAPVAPQVSGQDVRTVSAPVSAPAPAPAPTSAPVAPHATGQSVRTVSAPVSAPVAAPVPPVSGQVPATPAAPPATPTVQLNKPGISVPLVPSPVSSPSVPSVPPAPVAQQPAPLATVSQISLPPIAKVCRDEIAKNRAVTDEELVEAVVAAGYDRDQINPDSIRRTAQRIDPDRKKAS